MVFTIRATYNGETRKWTTDDVFPTYQALSDQIHRHFRTVDNFYLSRITVLAADGHPLLFQNKIDPPDWDIVRISHHGSSDFHGGCLKFNVQDVLDHRKVPSRIRTGHSQDMEVDEDPQPAVVAPQPQTRQQAPIFVNTSSNNNSNRNSMISDTSTCCSVSSAKGEIKGLVDGFLKDFQKTMADTFGDDLNADHPERERTPVPTARPTSPIGAIPGAFNPPREVVHPNVICDHCNKTVKGTRFKCEVCVDFDICEACMGNNMHGRAIHSAQFDIQHSFLAMAEPITSLGSNVRTRCTRPRPSNTDTQPVHNAYCNVCSKTIVGVRHKCLDCPDYDMCNKCMTDKRQEHDESHEFFALNEPGRVVIHNVDRPFPHPVPPTTLRATNCPNFGSSTAISSGGDAAQATDSGPSRIPPTGHRHIRHGHGHPHVHGPHRHHPFSGPFGQFVPPPPPHGWPFAPPPFMNPAANTSEPIVQLPAQTQIAPVANQTEMAHNATCDMCDSKIMGVRNKCLDCPDYDVCTACFSIVGEQHPHHAFVKVADPKDLTIKQSHYNNRTVHNARCDCCNKQITGARFKCIHPNCDDYDLCENCEALPISVHPSSHALVKLRQTISTYEGLQKVFAFAHQPASQAVQVPTRAEEPVIRIPDAEFPSLEAVDSLPQPEPVVAPVPVMEQISSDGDAMMMQPPAVPTRIPVPAPITMDREWWDMLLNSQLHAAKAPTTQAASSVHPHVLEAEGEMEAPNMAPISRHKAIQREFVDEESASAWRGLVSGTASMRLEPAQASGSGSGSVRPPSPVFSHVPSVKSDNLDVQSLKSEPASVKTEGSIINVPSPFADENAVVIPPSATSSVLSFQSLETPLTTSIPNVGLRPSASFVADNSIPDGFVLTPGSRFVKSWKLVNDGQVTWPVGTALHFTGGDRLGTSPEVTLEVGAGTRPGQSADIETEFIAPSVAGKYASFWRLKDSDGKPFGHRLWCVIEVVESDKSSSNSSLASSAVIMPALASIVTTQASTEVPTLGPASPIPETPAVGGTATISSLPSEVDIDESASDFANDSESDVSGAWEEPSRAASPDEFVMVYESEDE